MTVFKKGDRIATKFGNGTVIDDYWAYKDRYRVRMDRDGSGFHVGAASLRHIKPSSVTVNARATTETE